MDCSMPGFPVHHQLRSLFKLVSIELVMPSNQLVLRRPLLLLPSIFPSIRVFSSDSALHIRWPKYWSLSFSISPSSEYSGLISSRTHWLVKYNYAKYIEIAFLSFLITSDNGVIRRIVETILIMGLL